MKHIKLFEQFINESAIKTIAKMYDATSISDIDSDDLYLGDDALNAFDKALKTKYNNDKAYMLNQNYVRDNGDSWETLIKTIKSKKLKHDIIIDDENDDVIVIFEEFTNKFSQEPVKESFTYADAVDNTGEDLEEEEKGIALALKALKAKGAGDISILVDTTEDEGAGLYTAVKKMKSINIDSLIYDQAYVGKYMGKNVVVFDSAGDLFAYVKESVNEKLNEPFGLRALMNDEKSEGKKAEVLVGRFDGRSINAQSTDKVFSDGVPVMKNFTRGGKKPVKLKGDFHLVDSSRGWWYIYGPQKTWYAVKQAEYGTPPFEL